MSERIFFSQVREDPSLELELIKDGGNCLLVGSGGCTLFSLMTSQKPIVFDVIDSNPAQLFLIQLKYQVILYSKTVEDVVKFFQGELSTIEYDQVLEIVFVSLSSKCKRFWERHRDWIYQGINQIGTFEKLFHQLVESNFDFNSLFNRKHLISLFGENSVIHSKNKEFFVHFQKIFYKYENLFSINSNYFFHQVVKNKYNIKEDLPIYLKDFERLKDNINKHNIHFINDDIVDWVGNNKELEKYHLVQISNVSDWIDDSIRILFFRNLRQIINKNGTLLARRLNGDYSLRKLMSELFEEIDDWTEKDKSCFYSEILIGKSKD